MIKMCKRFYLAYGSNLNIPQMQRRCPTAKIVGVAEIEDYELLFKGSKTGSYLTIEPKKGATVPVAVWEIKKADETNLDMYEGFPRFYYKKDFRVRCRYIKSGRTKTLNTFAYIMDERRKLGVPNSYYINTCLNGYDSFGFDTELIFQAIDKSLNALKKKKGVKRI